MQESNETEILLNNIITILKENKSINISILNLEKIDVSVCKYFVICSGNSSTHIASISTNLVKDISKLLKEKPWSQEGKETCEWILIDYADIVIHVFKKEIRDFYAIEDLWGDAEIKNIKN